MAVAVWSKKATLAQKQANLAKSKSVQMKQHAQKSIHIIFYPSRLLHVSDRPECDEEDNLKIGCLNILTQMHQ